MNSVLLSVITVTYNCEDLLSKTIESFNDQLNNIDCRDIEWIAIDGASKDNTFEIIEKEVDLLQNRGVTTYTKSEKDNGIYDAMNKGLSVAHGEWIYMLNAGDLFYDEYVLKDVIDCFIEDTDVIVGSALRFNEYYSEIWKPDVISELKKRMIFCHQSMFIKRTLDEHHYDTKYRYCSDYDLSLRLYSAGYRFKEIDRIITQYSLEGITGDNGMIEAFKEIYAIRKVHRLVRFPVENIMYLFGKVKRRIIILLPPRIRWGIKRTVVGAFHNSSKWK